MMHAVQFMRSTSLADYFAVADVKVVIVRLSNTFNNLCCLTCRQPDCEHTRAVEQFRTSYVPPAEALPEALSA